MENAIQYIRAARAELMKVSWPSRRDTIRYSTLVVAVSLAVAAFFGLLDTGLGKSVELLITRTPQAPETSVPAVPTNNAKGVDIPGTLTPIDIQTEPVNGKPVEVKVVPQPTAPSPAAPVKP